MVRTVFIVGVFMMMSVRSFVVIQFVINQFFVRRPLDHLSYHDIVVTKFQFRNQFFIPEHGTKSSSNLNTRIYTARLFGLQNQHHNTNSLGFPTRHRKISFTKPYFCVDQVLCFSHRNDPILIVFFNVIFHEIQRVQKFSENYSKIAKFRLCAGHTFFTQCNLERTGLTTRYHQNACA